MRRLLIFLYILAVPYLLVAQNNSVVNFNSGGDQITRNDLQGNALDAHDGEVVKFGDTFYLYGTSYGCGFEWNNKEAPFCGFKVYSSPDMVNWQDKGPLFDATSDIWQKRCDGKTYGCFRPHVLYNSTTNKYVLWINVYDNVSGFRAFTSDSPVGPFVEVAEPKLLVNKDVPAAELNNGDHDLFLDDDGKAYVAFTDWRKGGSIVIEELDKTFLSGTGNLVARVTTKSTEAPALFKRNGIYYLTYSDPNCGYCSGTGTSYTYAKTIAQLGENRVKISQNSCGGQPSFVSVFEHNGKAFYMYGSDLWNNAAKNEAMANFYWAPLEFYEDGRIKPMACEPHFSIEGDQSKEFPGDGGYTRYSDISAKLSRSQSFVINKDGVLEDIRISLFKNGRTDQPLEVSIYKIGDESKALYSVKLDALSWSPEMVMVSPKLKVKIGERYKFVLKTATTVGSYGFSYSDHRISKEEASISKDGGVSYVVEPGRSLKFDVVIR